MEKIKELIKKVCTKEVIFYIIFGVLTTLVNIGSFYIMTNILNWNENVSNIIAILLAVLFAYATNKDIVFHSDAKNLKEKLNQFLKFILGRAVTMIIEYLGCLILFEQTAIPQMVSKCFVTIIIIVLNFFISKFFAFKKKTKIEE